MKKLILTVFAAILAIQIGSVYGQLGSDKSPFDRNFADVKFLDAYFGRPNEKIEVTPGDKNVPFTVVFANVGSQDITGIKGQLQMPIGFTPSDGKGALILADSDSEAIAGKHFSLTFFVNIDEHAPIQQYPASVKLDYSRLREAGQRTSFFDFKFKVTGESILNMKAVDPVLTSLKNNKVTVEITNAGTAPMSSVKIVLQNTQTALSSTTTSITNMENVVFDQSKWTLGTINPKSTKYFTFHVYIPEGVRGNTLRAIMDVTHFNAHGDQVNTQRSVDFFINGLIDARIYNIGVIKLGEKQTVIGEVINEGNVNALFSFVTLEPLDGSNLKPQTQFIDELETDSPVPFNIPIEFDGEPKYGDHKVKITVRYKDSMRQEHLISEEATITLENTAKAPEPSVSDYMPGMIVVIVAAIAGTVIYKKIKRKKEVTSEPES